MFLKMFWPIHIWKKSKFLRPTETEIPGWNNWGYINSLELPSLTKNHSVCALWFKFIFLFLGGYGKSPDSESLKTDQNRVDLLSRFMESLGVRTAVLVSPSMSGHYSIPFLMKSKAQLRGFVPIAPVGTRNYTPQQYQNIQVSSLRF